MVKAIPNETTLKDQVDGIRSTDIEKRDRTLAMIDAPAWRPQPGDILTGRTVMIRKGGENSEWGVYPVIVLAPLPGFPFVPAHPDYPTEGDLPFVAWHAFHTIPKEQLAKIRPNPRNETVVTIKYAGRVTFGTTVDGPNGERVYVEDKDHSDYESYTVMEGDGSNIETDTFDWDTDIKADPRKS